MLGTSSRCLATARDLCCATSPDGRTVSLQYKICDRQEVRGRYCLPSGRALSTLSPEEEETSEHSGRDLETVTCHETGSA